MPKKSVAVATEKGPETVILRMGKANNIIQWKDQMYILATGLYGTTGTFFNTNKSYQVPFPLERDYNPLYGMGAPPVPQVAVGPAVAAAHVAGAEEEDEERESEIEESLSDISEAEIALAGVAPEVSAALINKLREKAYENRQRLVEKRNSDERLLFPFTWSLMSIESQSKVREDPDFERAYAELDVVKLWKFIRRSHLTHIYGDSDCYVCVY